MKRFNESKLPNTSSSIIASVQVKNSNLEVKPNLRNKIPQTEKDSNLVIY